MHRFFARYTLERPSRMSCHWLQFSRLRRNCQTQWEDHRNIPRTHRQSLKWSLDCSAPWQRKSLPGRAECLSTLMSILHSSDMWKESAVRFEPELLQCKGPSVGSQIWSDVNQYPMMRLSFILPTGTTVCVNEARRAQSSLDWSYNWKCLPVLFVDQRSSLWRGKSLSLLA